MRVVAGVPDGKGHYSCTIPATDYLPARTILVSPANAPGVGGPGAISTPIDAPQAILHTGGQTQPSNIPILTPYPGLDEQGFNDLIVVPPLERDDGPIYVMLSGRQHTPGRPDPDFQPNRGAVGNIGEFFRQPGFGSQLMASSRKTTQTYKGQQVYHATDDMGRYIQRRDKFYLDSAHMNHLEVFDKNNNCKVVLNLDSSLNDSKTAKALEEKRKLSK